MTAVIIAIGLLAGTFWTLSFMAGGALLWRGFRGRRIDDDPRCGDCDYNLRGLPIRPDRCPECGGELRGINRVYLGRREWSPRVVAAGSAVLLLSVSPVVLQLVRTKAITMLPIVAAAAPVAPIMPRRNITRAELNADAALINAESEANMPTVNAAPSVVNVPLTMTGTGSDTAARSLALITGAVAPRGRTSVSAYGAGSEWAAPSPVHWGRIPGLPGPDGVAPRIGMMTPGPGSGVTGAGLPLHPTTLRFDTRVRSRLDGRVNARPVGSKW